MKLLYLFVFLIVLVNFIELREILFREMDLKFYCDPINPVILSKCGPTNRTVESLKTFADECIGIVTCDPQENTYYSVQVNTTTSSYDIIFHDSLSCINEINRFSDVKCNECKYGSVLECREYYVSSSSYDSSSSKLSLKQPFYFIFILGIIIISVF